MYFFIGDVMNEKLKVDGFLFGTAADAAIAKEEHDKVEYLDSNVNYANIGKVAQLYDRAIDSKMFMTPVGWNYLNKLRNILLQNGYIEEEIRPIPLYSVFSKADENIPVMERIKPKKRKADPYKNRFIIASIVSGVLIVTVLVMFLIAMTSETPNMINYRNAIVNEYASWEQDIKDREDRVREKERELSLPSPLPHEEQMILENKNKED